MPLLTQVTQTCFPTTALYVWYHKFMLEDSKCDTIRSLVDVIILQTCLTELWYLVLLWYFLWFSAMKDSRAIAHQHCLPVPLYYALLYLPTCQFLRKHLTSFQMCFFLSHSLTTKWHSQSCLCSFYASNILVLKRGCQVLHHEQTIFHYPSQTPQKPHSQ